MQKKKEKTKEIIDITNDYFFQVLFSKKNKDITKYFVQALLGKKIEKMEINTIKGLEREYFEGKLGILDLQVTIEEKELLDVEIQVTDYKNFVKRMLYYWGRLYSSSIEQGGKYTDLKRTILISIINFDIENVKEIAKMQTNWVIREKEEKTVILTDLLKLVIIDLRKVKKEYLEKPEEIINQWMMIIKSTGLRKEEIEKIKTNVK